MNSIYKTAVDISIKRLSENLKKIYEVMDNEPIWSDITHIDEPSAPIPNVSISKSVGVYRIIYKPTMKTMSIGCGNVSARKARHLGVFKNNGKTIISSNGSPSGSMTGMHMFKYDKNIKNWLFQWCNIGNKELSEVYETLLQKQENPLFNSECMAGK
jgi:hypothetical protein